MRECEMGEGKRRGKCHFPLFGWSEKVDERKLVDEVFYLSHHLSPFQIDKKREEKMAMRRKVQYYVHFTFFYFALV